jgi:uncharacterized protein (TIGR00645 family)
MRYFAVTAGRFVAEKALLMLDLCPDDRIIQRPDMTGDAMENFLEKLMYSSRWIMAPIYLGLSLALLALGIKFFQEVLHIMPIIFSMKEVELILVVLSLIDIALVGGLIVMVMFSGYENFVSRLDLEGNDDKLSWLGKLDSGSLKNKVAASIVAISSIHLLKVFMNTESIANDKIQWYLLIHITFVLSAFAMGYLDKVLRK